MEVSDGKDADCWQYADYSISPHSVAADVSDGAPSAETLAVRFGTSESAFV